MSSHEKRQRGLRLHNNKAQPSPSSSTVIATPPRAALHNRRETQQQQHTTAEDNASSATSIKGNTTPPDAIAGQEHVSPDQHSDEPPPQYSTATSSSSSHANANSASLPAREKDREKDRDRDRDREREKDKDHQIAELEIDIATMTDEFERELTSLSHRLTNETESATFWRQKHSHLNQTFLKTDTDLKLLQQELAHVQSNREERDRDIKTRISSLMLDRDQFREAYNQIVRELARKEEEVEVLRGQVRGLKSWVSSSSKVDEQVTDEVFGEGMQRLGNSLQNWVITNFRRVKIDTDKTNEEMKEQLLQLIPTYETLAASSKIHLIQSLVSRLLVDRIFEAYFIGLSEQHAEELERVEKYLTSFGSLESMNQWRSTTLAIIRKEASENVQVETAEIVEKLVLYINTIMVSISDIQPSDSRDQSLRTLLNNSIELSRLLRVQKADFNVVMPCIEGHQRTVFDPECMEDIGGEDEDTLDEREIRCVTFPGIFKSGDENGERSHLKNVVAKIRVLCAPD